MAKRTITGRPFLYGHIVGYLEDETLYSPATIARLIIPQWKQHRAAYTKIRHAFVGFAARKHLKTEIEGYVKIGSRSMPAWYGKTWKAQVEPADLTPPVAGMTLLELQQFWVGAPSPIPVSPYPAAPPKPRYLFGWSVTAITLFSLLGLWFVSPNSPSPPQVFSQKAQHFTPKKPTTDPSHMRETGKQSGEYAAFSRRLQQQRLHPQKCRRISVPYTPAELAVWNTHTATPPVAVASAQPAPSTVYIFNVRGAGLFPH